MARFQVRLNTAYGELTLAFDSEAELQQAIQEVPALIKVLGDAGPLLQVERKAPSGFEDLCTIDHEGLPRLLKHPVKKSDVVRLILFLAPRPLTAKQWQDASGVSNPIAYVAKKDLLKGSDSRYSLEAAARTYVVNKVIPTLRGAGKV
jgi:hypothetical protein